MFDFLINRIRQLGVRHGPVLLAALCLPVVASADMFTRDHGGPPEERGVLRVCADPNSPPFSMADESGFENRLAELIAEDLGLPLEYTWYPQRFGYTRATIRRWLEEEGRYRCDVLMGVPQQASGFSTTTPYYHSTHVVVFPKDSGLELEQASDLLALDAQTQSRIRIGAFDRSPATDWLIRNGLRSNIKGYILADGDLSFYAGKIIEDDLMNGTIDVAIIWGPIAGYFAAKVEKEMVLLPLQSAPGAQFDYPVSIGVRAGDHEMLRPLQVALRNNQEKVEALIEEYNLYTVEDPRRARRETR